MVVLEVAVGCRATHLNICKSVQGRVRTSPHMCTYTVMLISGFHRAFFKVSHFYWPTNALNCIKLKG